MTDAKDLEKALERLDLKGLLVLQGLINQQALKYVLDAEPLTTKFKAKKKLKVKP